ncbi:MAG: GNAT family N-acetyltransferase [Anaerolineaceae bacterium]|nr:GNAT family N-acetyltransferase [Anaerolineaceae bacterium]
MSSSIEIGGYTPGVIGRVTELHGVYYHQHWGFGLYFEAKVATELAAFLSRMDPAHDGAWIARADGQVVGSVFIDGRDAHRDGARLRWFITDPTYQGRGLGRRLMTEAVRFCQQAEFPKVYLTTFAGLDAARHLYEQFGFQLIHEAADNHWGTTVVEQQFELVLAENTFS